MGARLRPAWLAATLAGLAISAGALHVGHRLEAREADRAAALRELRATLQRATHARVRLERDGDRARWLEVDIDDVRLAILGAVESLAHGARVGLLGHALREPGREARDDAPPGDDPGDLRTLRLVVELEAVHALRLTEALDALAGALPGRPVDIAGCRIERAGAASLVASCALDWYWWPT